MPPDAVRTVCRQQTGDRGVSFKFYVIKENNNNKEFLKPKTYYIKHLHVCPVSEYRCLPYFIFVFILQVTKQYIFNFETHSF